MLLAPDPVGGDVARRAAARELSKAQYHRDDPGLVERAIGWLLRRAETMFSGGVGGNALLLFVILLGAAVIFAVVRAGRPSRAARRALTCEDDPLRPIGARDHRRLAAEFERAGDHAQALREWLRAAVGTIEERGVLVERPGRTGAATAREAGPLLPAVADDLRTATNAFDEVWFGGRAATPADVALARRVAEGVGSARIQRRVTAGYAVPR